MAVTYAVCTWRCWTLLLLQFERERTQLVYEFILFNMILISQLLSAYAQWNYAFFNIFTQYDQLAPIKLWNCRNALRAATHRMSFRSLKQSCICFMHDQEILRHCVTSSLALDNWRQKYCQTLGYKPNPSISQCDFQCLILPTIQKYSLPLKLKKHIKQLQMGRRSTKNLTWLNELSYVKNTFPVIWYLKCNSSWTQTPDSKRENRSNSWVWSKLILSFKYFDKFNPSN